jgi:cytochrome P450
MDPVDRTARFPVGAVVTLEDLTGDMHPCLARLRTAEPVSWLPAIGGWLVTGRDSALAVLRDADSFTVDDPRFSTARVVGPSMLSTDGADHARHRAPFAGAFRHAVVMDEFGDWTAIEARRLLG